MTQRLEHPRWCPGCGAQPCFTWPPPVVHCGAAEYEGRPDCGWRIEYEVEPGEDIVVVAVEDWQPPPER